MLLGTAIKLVMYFIGQALHIALQADAVVRAKNNTTATYGSFLRMNAIRLAWRMFVCTLIFVFWWNNPTTIVDLFGYIGWSIPERIAHFLSLPMSGATAGFFGLGCDSVLSFIPGLKNLVPKVDE